MLAVLEAETDDTYRIRMLVEFDEWSIFLWFWCRRCPACMRRSSWIEALVCWTAERVLRRAIVDERRLYTHAGQANE